MSPQTSYSETPAKGLPGMLVRPGDAVVATKKSDDEIPYGRLVCYDGADDKVTLPAADTDVSTKGIVQGIAMRSPKFENNDAGVARHLANRAFDVIKKGPVYVEVEQDVTPGDIPYVRFAENPGASSVQEITPSAAPTEGEFTLKYSPDGVTEQETEAIAYNANAAAIQAALEALAGIGAGNVAVTGSLASTIEITFQGDLELQPVGEIYEGDTNTLLETATPVTLSFEETTVGEYAEDKIGAFRKDADDEVEARAEMFPWARFAGTASRGGVVALELNIIGAPVNT